FAYVDSTLEFVITPFNENSDSLEYSWFLDNEPLDSDSASVSITFPETGQSEITSIVHDGIETDTIHWTVNVEEWSFTADEADLAELLFLPVLYPSSPNPFNSTVKLSIYMPKIDHVSLSVFDINGREVSRLVDGNVGAGRQTFVWNAGDFSAGVYVVRMSAGDVSEMRKMVLVR
ncbi:MAG: T9SS type A sorting domain-containing protein, partial [Calditrichaeota bacterium]|nr:T9SS type A sorting domain-containing protein [Calditrichota bacterium]